MVPFSLIPFLILAVQVPALPCQGSPPLAILPNVSYGPDPQQIMDVYLPEGRNGTVTKVIVLIHGGGWSSGAKENMNNWVPFFYYSLLPIGNYAIVNLSYRLGTMASPGVVKQLQDIRLALDFLRSKATEYLITQNYALTGASAGGHLSMLYAYAMDEVREVRLVCNLVGPASLLDPAYTENGFYDFLFLPLVGNYTYAQNPWIYYAASPLTYITPASPKTISFYGNADPLIPATQGPLLEDKLDSVGVYNKMYLYPGGGHLTFTPEQNAHMYKKIRFFFKNYL